MNNVWLYFVQQLKEKLHDKLYYSGKDSVGKYEEKKIEIKETLETNLIYLKDIFGFHR